MIGDYMNMYKKEVAMDRGTELYFKDAVFKQAIKDLFHLDDSMTKEDLEKIEEIIFYDHETGTRCVELNGEITSLEDLQYFPHLKRLILNCSDLENDEIYGELKSIEHLTQLETLDLWDCVIEGDIGVLKNLTNLTQLVITGKKISGKIADISDLKKLKEIGFINTNITGELKNFQCFSELEELFVPSAYLTGNLEDLVQLKKLTLIGCGDAERITGDISVLKELNNLESLLLYHTHITGNIRDLKRLEKLKILNLSQTSVSGNINDIDNLADLRTLELSSCRGELIGDIEVLKNMPYLQCLDLSLSQVKGDIASLSTLEYLNEVNLGLSQVFGDPLSLTELPNLDSCFLASSSVDNDAETQKKLKDINMNDVIIIEDLSDGLE